MAVTRTPDLELHVTGMTCASCSARVERCLNEVPGVEASVNLATETASVRFTGEPIESARLVSAVQGAGYGAGVLAGDVPDTPAADGSLASLVVAALCGVPVIVLSMLPDLQFPYWQWVAAVLATPVVWWAGRAFHVRAWSALQRGQASMDTLISMGSVSAWGYSLVALVALGAGGAHERMTMTMTAATHAEHPVYFEVACGVVLLILFGRYLEDRARRRAGDAVRSLLTLQARSARIVRDGQELSVPIADVQVGDLVVVAAGEQVPVDARIVDGTTSLNTSMVTGEPLPQHAGPGDEVIGGTLNLGSPFTAETVRVGDATMLAQVSRRVRDAQAGKAQVQRLADRVSGVFVPVVAMIALATLVYWVYVGETFAQAFGIAVSVLIVACPCAMGLATPVALLTGTGRGARAGVLIGGAEVLESTRRVDTVVLDKTGTLTEGRMRVVRVVPADGVDADEELGIAARIEQFSRHPVAGAIVAEAGARNANVTDLALQVHELPGRGVTGRVRGEERFVASLPHVREQQLALPGALVAAAEAAEAEAQTVVATGTADGGVRALILLSDEPRPGSSEAVRRMRELGLRVLMLTGDLPATAHAVARRVGIDERDVIAGVLPTDKADAIAALQQAGAVVAMVGDGINDAPALAQADLGISMGSGADTAIQAADITLVGSRITAVPDAIRLARATLRTIQGNLFWAFAYNVLAIPLAASGNLNPVIAAGAMAFSSLFVVLNSLRLRAFRFGADAG